MFKRFFLFFNFCLFATSVFSSERLLKIEPTRGGGRKVSLLEKDKHVFTEGLQVARLKHLLISDPAEALRITNSVRDKVYRYFDTDPNISLIEIYNWYEECFPWMAFSECRGNCPLARENNPEYRANLEKAILDHICGTMDTDQQINIACFGSGYAFGSLVLATRLIANGYKKINFSLIDPDYRLPLDDRHCINGFVCKPNHFGMRGLQRILRFRKLLAWCNNDLGGDVQLSVYIDAQHLINDGIKLHVLQGQDFVDKKGGPKALADFKKLREASMRKGGISTGIWKQQNVVGSYRLLNCDLPDGKLGDNLEKLLVNVVDEIEKH